MKNNLTQNKLNLVLENKKKKYIPNFLIQNFLLFVQSTELCAKLVEKAVCASLTKESG